MLKLINADFIVFFLWFCWQSTTIIEIPFIVKKNCTEDHEKWIFYLEFLKI